MIRFDYQYVSGWSLARDVEILLATVRPWQLMIGKVVGLGTVGLVQVAVIAFACQKGVRR